MTFDPSYLAGVSPEELRNSPNMRADASRLIKLDPRIACMILRGDAQMVPQKYGMRGKFANPTPDEFVDIGFDAPVTQDLLVQDMSYVIRSNGGAASGTVYQYFAANQFAQNSGIDATVTFTGGYSMSWLLSNSQKPIESLFRWEQGAAHTSCCKEFLLVFPQELKARLTLTQTLDDPQTEVIITVHGLTLGFQKFGGLSLTEARAVLSSEYGFPMRGTVDARGGTESGGMIERERRGLEPR
jgi:hypothetical protein